MNDEGGIVMIEKSMPYIDSSGNLIVPFSTDPQYHYWNGGQPLSATLQEMKTSEDF